MLVPTCGVTTVPRKLCAMHYRYTARALEALRVHKRPGKAVVLIRPCVTLFLRAGRHEYNKTKSILCALQVPFTGPRHANTQCLISSQQVGEWLDNQMDSHYSLMFKNCIRFCLEFGERFLLKYCATMKGSDWYFARWYELFSHADERAKTCPKKKNL